VGGRAVVVGALTYEATAKQEIVLACIACFMHTGSNLATGLCSWCWMQRWRTGALGTCAGSLHQYWSQQGPQCLMRSSTEANCDSLTVCRVQQLSSTPPPPGGPPPPPPRQCGACSTAGPGRGGIRHVEATDGRQQCWTQPRLQSVSRQLGYYQPPLGRGQAGPPAGSMLQLVHC
jgi:hypothetical protein